MSGHLLHFVRLCRLLMLQVRWISLLGGLVSGLLHPVTLVLQLSWLLRRLLRVRCRMLLKFGGCWLLRSRMLMLGCRLLCSSLDRRLTDPLSRMPFVSITQRRVVLHRSRGQKRMSSRLYLALVMSPASHTHFSIDSSPCFLDWPV